MVQVIEYFTPVVAHGERLLRNRRRDHAFLNPIQGPLICIHGNDRDLACQVFPIDHLTDLRTRDGFQTNNSVHLILALEDLPGVVEGSRRVAFHIYNLTYLYAWVCLEHALIALQPLIQARLGDPANPTLSAAEMKAYAERSIKNLARLARGEVAGYDVMPAGPTVLAALRAPSKLTPEGQIAALEVASRLRGEEAQTVLANVLTDGKRPVSVCVAAANALVRHIQEFSPLLTRDQMRVVQAMYVQPNLALPLKSSLAVVIGSLQPNSRLTGERLLQYQPPVPGAPPKKEK